MSSQLIHKMLGRRSSAASTGAPVTCNPNEISAGNIMLRAVKPRTDPRAGVLVSELVDELVLAAPGAS